MKTDIFIRCAKRLMAHMSRPVMPLLFVLVCCPAMGQVLKKQLTEADYHLWSHLAAGTLSGDAKWASYSVGYESGADTLFVSAIDGNMKYNFAGGKGGTFFGRAKFACLHRDRLEICDLLTGKNTALAKVDRFEASDKFLFAQIGDTLKTPLVIYGESGNEIYRIENVSAWSYDRNAKMIVYRAGSNGDGKVYCLKIEEPFLPAVITGSANVSISEFAWQENGRSVAFLIHRGDTVGIGLYRFAERKFAEFSPPDFKGFPAAPITSTSFAPLQVSADGKRVFFGISGKSFDDKEMGRPEVWNTLDKNAWPVKHGLNGFEGVDKIGCWWPGDHRFMQLTDNVLPVMMPDNAGKRALLWNADAYKPDQKMFSDVDLYLSDIETGERKKIIEKQTSLDLHAFFSPNGKYVCYFRENNWWAYAVATGISRNLTAALPVHFQDEGYDWPDVVPAYGCAGWTADGNSGLFNDGYDVWRVDMDGNATRLTNGRENGIVFRLIPQNGIQRSGSYFAGERIGVFNLGSGLLLSGSDGTTAALYRWTVKNGIAKLAESTGVINAETYIADSESLLYVEQDYDLPPRLMFRKGRRASKMIFQSNPQHFRYKWETQAGVTYKNRSGEILKGMLYYPAGYENGKKYPVIVRIYDKQTVYKHDYINPTLYSQAGYNRTKFTSDGYFVFEPDINYEMNDPGISAADCVIAGVKAIIAIPGVDETKIGLMGQSFGGYETDFILTQTNIFACAISSSGISDLTSYYLWLNRNSETPNTFMFEAGQFRMSKTLFENRDGFAANSPVNFVEKIKTPLFIWVGKDDVQVPPEQSMELYMALRRLGKPGVMLVYPNERHTLMKREDQDDLSGRVKQWFGCYLKGNTGADWMRPEKL